MKKLILLLMIVGFTTSCSKGLDPKISKCIEKYELEDYYDSLLGDKRLSEHPDVVRSMKENGWTFKELLLNYCTQQFEKGKL